MADTIFASPETEAIYGDIFPVIQELYPDLELMIITDRDLTGGDTKYDGLDFSFLGFCNWPMLTDAMAEADSLFYDTTSVFVRKLYEFSEGHENSVFIPRNQLNSLASQNFNDMNTIAFSATFQALTMAPAAANINQFFPDIENPIAITTMPHEFMEPLEFAAGVSGMHQQYLLIEGTADDWAKFTLGHELSHATDQTPYEDDPYHCTRVNLASSDDTLAGEVQGDIDGAIFFKALEARGLTSGTDIISQMHHLRAIGSLLKTDNLTSVNSSEDLHGHITNLGFDADQDGYRDQFNHASLKDITGIPMLINTYVDTIAGYLKAEHIRQNSGLYREDMVAFVDGLPTDPSEILVYWPGFSYVSLDSRKYDFDTEYYNAALYYLVESGGFEKLKAGLKPEYTAAVDDLLNDYTEAVQAVTKDIDPNKFGDLSRYGFDTENLTKEILGFSALIEQSPEEFTSFQHYPHAIPQAGLKNNN